MSKADYYRRRHRALMDKFKQEESWPMTILNTVAFVLCCMVWVSVFTVVVEKM